MITCKRYLKQELQDYVDNWLVLNGQLFSRNSDSLKVTVGDYLVEISPTYIAVYDEDNGLLHHDSLPFNTRKEISETLQNELEYIESLDSLDCDVYLINHHF